MANFYSGNLALGTGSSDFVEMTGAGYARQAITFGPIDHVSGKCIQIAAVTFTPSGQWMTATQLGLYDPNGSLLMFWTLSVPLVTASGIPNILSAGRLSIDWPIPSLTGDVVYDIGLGPEVEGGATLSWVRDASVQIMGQSLDGVTVSPGAFNALLASLPTSQQGSVGAWLSAGVLHYS